MPFSVKYVVYLDDLLESHWFAQTAEFVACSSSFNISLCIFFSAHAALLKLISYKKVYHILSSYSTTIKDPHSLSAVKFKPPWRHFSTSKTAKSQHRGLVCRGSEITMAVPPQYLYNMGLATWGWRGVATAAVSPPADIIMKGWLNGNIPIYARL